MRTWRLPLAATVMVALLWGMGTVAAQSDDADATGTFAPAGSLAEARSSHPATLLTATLLPDGRVLVSGGRGADDTVPAPEVWDPQSQSFTASGAPTSVRLGVTYAPLPDGRVLLVGGRDAEDVRLPSAEVWDPATGTFEPVGPMAEARDLPGVTLLPDGRVLVFGGRDASDSLTSAEVWDPATGSFAPAGTMVQPRDFHGSSATPLPAGRVLLVGGDWFEAEKKAYSAEVWDPATMTFEPTGWLREGRTGHSATLLADGRVLVVGGNDQWFRVMPSPEVWDPATGRFEPTGSPREERDLYSTSLLPDGRVLVIGGRNVSGEVLASAEVWDPGTGTFAPAGSLNEPREAHTATLLPDGRVLVVGGWGADDKLLGSAEVWSPREALPGAGGEASDEEERTATGTYEPGDSLGLLFPRHVAGEEFVEVTTHGPTHKTTDVFDGESVREALLPFGKEPADIHAAAGHTRARSIWLLALRVEGMAGEDLVDVVLGATTGQSPIDLAPFLTDETLGGQAVSVLRDPLRPDSAQAFYPKGEVLFMVTASSRQPGPCERTFAYCSPDEMLATVVAELALGRGGFTPEELERME